MRDNAPIEIQNSRTKLAALFILALLFVAAGLWFLLKPQDIASSAFNDEGVLRLIGVATLVFSSGCSIFIINKLTDKKPGVVISDDGFLDRSNAGSIGFVPWSDVISIDETKVLNQKFVSVDIKDPERYINLQQGNFKRTLINANFKSFGYVVSISANGLQCHHHQLKTLLEDAFKDYKARNARAL
jgi:hypothetical protein